MKKVLATLLSVFIIISFSACSGSNPEPPQENVDIVEDPPSQVEQVADDVGKLESVFEDPAKTKVTTEDGITVTAVSENYVDEATGYTVLTGSEKREGTGLSSTTMNYSYSNAAGQEVTVKDTTSTKIQSVTNGEAAAIGEADVEEAEAAINAAKQIPSISFVEEETDNGVKYTYDPSAAYKLSRNAAVPRTVVIDGSSISRIVVTYSYGENRVEYTYDVTYIANGNSVTVRETLVKVTEITVDGGEAEDLSEQLREEYSIGQLQGGGRYEAIALAFIVHNREKYNQSGSDKEEYDIVLNDNEGNPLIRGALSVYSDYSDQSTESEQHESSSSAIDIKLSHVGDSLGLPIEGGSTVSISSYAKTDSAPANSGWKSRYENKASVAINGTAVFAYETTEESYMEQNSAESGTHVTVTTSTSTTDILELAAPIPVGEDAVIKKGDTIRVETTLTETYGEDGYPIDENTTSVYYLNNAQLDVSGINLSSLLAGFESFVAAVNNGVSVAISGGSGTESYEFYSNSSSTETFTGRRKTDVSINLSAKQNFIDSLMEILTGSGDGTEGLKSWAEKNLSGVIVTTSTYTFPERFEDVSQLTVIETSHMFELPEYELKFTGGSLQGTYSGISEDDFIEYGNAAFV